MIGLFRILLAISVLVFPIASLLSVGLGFTLREIAAPLRHPQKVFRALVASFVLVPLLAFGIARGFALAPPFAAGLMLIGTAAGAPFLLKLTQAAKGDVALSATLLVLLMPITVVYMPLVIPLVVADATVRATSIAIPLFLTLLLPLIVGLVMDSVLPRVSAWLRPVAITTSTVALIVLVTSTLVVNADAFWFLVRTRALWAGVLLIIGSFGIGYLLASPGGSRRTVLGLGTAQRNVAAAMVVATQEFADRDVFVMVVVISIVDLLVLFPIAWILRRQRSRPAPPSPIDPELAGLGA